MRTKSEQSYRSEFAQLLWGDFPSRNRESGRDPSFDEVGKTLEKVKMHIIIRA